MKNEEFIKFTTKVFTDSIMPREKAKGNSSDSSLLSTWNQYVDSVVKAVPLLSFNGVGKTLKNNPPCFK